MAIATHMSLEEYRNADFEGDPEYVNGEILDRNIGELDHSWTIRNLMFYFASREAAGIFALQTWTFKLTESHFRVPDFVIVAGSEPDEQILETRPLVCVEVLSPEDRAGPMLRKIADYLNYGVRYVWVLDPQTRKAFAYTDSGMQEVKDGFLRTENPAIEIPLSAIFEETSDQI
jgi:Uma2 family endonuclease